MLEKKQFSVALKTLAAEMHLSFPMIARMIGYSSSHMSRVVTGEYQPTSEMVEKIIEVFQLNPRWPNLEDGDSLFSDVRSTEGNQKASPGFRLLSWRKENQITQQALSETCGISIPNLIAIEKGKRAMTTRMAKRIESSYNVSASWLLFGTEEAKEYPCGDEMIEFLEHHPEARKMVWDLIKEKKK